MTFANRLKDLRKERGLTQAELSEKLGVSKGAVAQWEGGKRKPSYKTLDAMSELFGKKIEYILGTTDDNSDVKKFSIQGTADVEDLRDNSSYATLIGYMQLDEYGKRAVESIINIETERCKKQNTLIPEDKLHLVIQLKNISFPQVMST